MKYDSTYKAEFATDGSGYWSITLPADCDEHDFFALESVVDGIKKFLEPTIEPPAAPAFLEPQLV